jgi:uncharacterized protein YjbI with pentapeptide repeats
MAPLEITKLLDAHRLWLETGGKKGGRADLEGADFQGAVELKGANLQRAILNHAEFKNADLTNANFQVAELRRANFDGAILRDTNFREADLQNANLETAAFLLNSQLAGTNVAGAKLPKPIAEFEGLKTIAEATSNAQKLLIAMLGGCLYCWLTIGTTKDTALLTNSASSPLPVIGTALPIVGFYLVAPVVLVALYFYFHLNMQRLWEALADLPAVFPDGRPLDKMADPWLLNGLVRAHFLRLRDERPPLSRMQQWLSIVLAWWVVPATLVLFWGRFLVRHDWVGIDLHVALLTASIGFGWMSYRLSRATLRGAPLKTIVWAQAWKGWMSIEKVAVIFGACAVGLIFYVISVQIIESSGEGIELTLEPGGETESRIVARLEPVFTPFANLAEEDISIKPPNWTGDVEQYRLVKGAHLPHAAMQYANARSAFLVNADMREAKLSYANLNHANLSGADLSRADLSHAYLSGADLSHAKLWVADVSAADLAGTNLSAADLTGTNLSGANLSGANLSGANLTGADISDAHLDGVDLRSATGLTNQQIGMAKTDEHTVLPANLPP